MTTLLPVTFFILECVALWQPVHWTSRWKTYLYTFFTISTVIIFCVDMGSQMIDIIDICKNISDCADNSFILLTMVGIFFKILSTLKNRKHIVDLVNRLQSGSFKPRNSAENKILNDFEYPMKWKTITFAVVLQMGTMNLIVQSLIYLAPHRMTITKLYLPWDSKTFIGYWTAWILQVFGRWLDGPIIVACDSLVSGILYRIAAQFKILQIRLHDLTNIEKIHVENDDDNHHGEHLETKKIVELIEEHLEIIKIVSKFNDIFEFVIFSQYYVSTVVLCTTIFVFSEVKQFDGPAALMVTYTASMYFQIYLLCSAGTEMTYQSINFSLSIYSSDWDGLRISTKKSLLLMMMRSQRPLKFTCFNIIDLSIDSFSQIVKFSYSAYNVLSQKK